MSSNKYITLSSSSSTVEMDPTTPGTFIRYAMAIEGALNILGALPMLLIPATLLHHITTSPLEVIDTSVALLQWIGALILGITPQLFLAIPNTRTAIESRRMVYLTLGAGELSLPAVFMLQAYGSNAGVRITRNALVLATGILVPLVLFRSYVLFAKPSLLGRYKVDGKTE